MAEVAVIGVNDARWGERPVAIVVLRQGCAPDAAALHAHVMRHGGAGAISKYAVPKRIQFVGTIAKTSVGELD